MRVTLQASDGTCERERDISPAQMSIDAEGGIAATGTGSDPLHSSGAGRTPTLERGSVASLPHGVGFSSLTNPESDHSTPSPSSACMHNPLASETLGLGICESRRVSLDNPPDDDYNDSLCVLCFSHDSNVRTEPDTPVCHRMQRLYGCHACSERDCWTQNPCCPQRFKDTLATINLSWASKASTGQVSFALQTYVAPKLSDQCRIRSRELGGGGDCLFHSFAGALGRMLLGSSSSAAHVFKRIPPNVWRDGERSVMTFLRRLSVDALSTWTPEDLLDYVLRARMDQKMKQFEDQWDPQRLLAMTGFEFLENCESVLAVGEELNGDATLRVAITEAYEGGGGRKEDIVTVEDGRAGLALLRNSLQAELRKPGNVHWGSHFDVKALSDALNIGVLVFCDRLQNQGRSCL